MIYEITAKEKLVIKFDSKTNFPDIFPPQSNFNIKPNSDVESIGNLLIEGIIENKTEQMPVRKNSAQKNNKIFFDFLEKTMNAHKNGIKLFQYVFLEAFRLVVAGRTSDKYFDQLENLFLDSFKLL